MFLAASQNPGIRGQHTGQGQSGLLRFALLPVAENTVDQIDKPYGYAKLGHSCHKRYQTRCPEQQSHEMSEVGSQGRKAILRDTGDGISSVMCQPLLSFFLAESLRPGFQCPEDLLLG